MCDAPVFPPWNQPLHNISKREREKRKKVIFLITWKTQVFFYFLFGEMCLMLDCTGNTHPGHMCVNEQTKLLQRWCPLVKRGELTRMQEFSGCCSNTVGCLLLLIFWRNLLSTPPTSHLLPPRPASFESAVGRSSEEISVFWLSWAPWKKRGGGEAYRWWRWRGEPWLEGWLEESRRTASRWPRRCSGRWWSSEHLDGESTCREKPQQDVQMCTTVWMTELDTWS